jgi:hypothetical protein
MFRKYLDMRQVSTFSKLHTTPRLSCKRRTAHLLYGGMWLTKKHIGHSTAPLYKSGGIIGELPNWASDFFAGDLCEAMELLGGLKPCGEPCVVEEDEELKEDEAEGGIRLYRLERFGTDEGWGLDDACCDSEVASDLNVFSS